MAAAAAERVAALIPTPAEDAWLDSHAAAEYLAVPYSTLKAWTARDGLPGYQDVEGGRWYFKRSELDDWRRSNLSRR